MGFDLGGAMSGVGAGAALGPWGMIGGGLIGGFLGGQDKPEMYSKEDMMATMKPYTDMLGDYKDKALDFMNPNSAANREMKQQLNQQSMDQMGVANMMSQRNDAANPYSGGSGVVSQIAQNNMLKYATQGTNAFQGFMGNQRQSGMNMYNNAIQQTGDLYSSAANLEAANIGTMNQYDQAQQQQMLQGGMSMLGGVGGYLEGAGGLGGLLKGFSSGIDGGPNTGYDPNSGGNSTFSFRQNNTQGIGMNPNNYNLINKPFNPQGSDQRLKENIEYITTSLEGYKIYEFDYKNKDGRYRGVMADDISTHPSVTKDSKGYYQVDYSQLDVDFERIS